MEYLRGQVFGRRVPHLWVLAVEPIKYLLEKLEKRKETYINVQHINYSQYNFIYFICNSLTLSNIKTLRSAQTKFSPLSSKIVPVQWVSAPLGDAPPAQASFAPLEPHLHGTFSIKNEKSF